MNILIVNPYYYPNMIGGTESSVKLLAEGLVAREHAVVVYTYDGSEERISTEEQNGVVVVRSGANWFHSSLVLDEHWSMGRKVYSRFKQLRNKPAGREVAALIEEYAIDVMHTNNLFGISQEVWKAAHQKGISIVHTLRDYFMLDPQYEIDRSPKFITGPYRSIYRKISNKYGPTCVTAPSRFTLDAFLEVGYFADAQAEVVSNAICFNEQESKKYIEEKSGRTSSDIRFLFAGKVADYKGITTLLSAFSKLKNDDCSLIICGEGPRVQDVESAASVDHRIEYLGKLNEEELLEQYRLADVVVVPSEWDEPFGRVAIEGLAAGAVVLVSKRGGLKEIFEACSSVQGFKSGDKEDLLRNLEALSLRKELKPFYGDMLTDLRQFSLDHQVDHFLKLYQRESGNTHE